MSRCLRCACGHPWWTWITQSVVLHFDWLVVPLSTVLTLNAEGLCLGVIIKSHLPNIGLCWSWKYQELLEQSGMMHLRMAAFLTLWVDAAQCSMPTQFETPPSTRILSRIKWLIQHKAIRFISRLTRPGSVTDASSEVGLQTLWSYYKIRNDTVS